MAKTQVIDPKYREKILKKATRVCARDGITIGYLGSQIVNDGDFFPRLENGADLFVSTLQKVDRTLNKRLEARA